MKSTSTQTPVRAPAIWILLFLLSFLPVAAIAATDDENFAIIQDRLLKSSSDSWAENAFIGLTKVNGNLDVNQIPSQALVKTAISKLDTATGLYTDIGYGLPNENKTDQIETRMTHLCRLMVLALAYRNNPSGYTETDQKISSTIIQGLTTWVNFFPKTPIKGVIIKDGVLYNPGHYPNGYGAVVLLVPELVKTNSDLWTKSIAYLTQYHGTWNTFGANSQAPYRAALIGHVLSKNKDKADILIREFLDRELSFSNRENDLSSRSAEDLNGTEYSKTEGFQPDYSFGQHTGTGRGNYWGHYGAGFVANMAHLMQLTAGTPFKLDKGIPFLTDAIEEGMQWSYYTFRTLDLQTNGRFYDGGSTRTNWGIKTSSSGYFAELAMLAREAKNTDCENRLNIIKNRIGNGNSPTTLTGDKMFWRADFHAHYGDNWRTSVRMSSTRTNSCEAGDDSTGQYNHYSGSGALYLLQTGLEYKCVSGESPSANWNWRRLPGITAEQYPDKATLPKHVWGEGGKGGTTFAGGASDGTYGAVGYKHYLADGAGSQPVTAYKAVFVFDKKYVMAGAGISETGGTYPVVTTINQTKLLTTNTGDNAISYFASGVQTDVPLSASTQPTPFSSGNAWVLSGNTGYVFPVGGSTYSFQQSYISGTVPPNKDDLFWLGIDHGRNPTNATYWCVVHPNTTSTDLTDYLANPDVVMAANTPEMQGAFGPQKVFQGIYYAAGTMSGTSWLRTVTVDQPCALILRPDNVASPTNLILTLSNPQCESVHIPAVTVTLNTTYKLAGAKDNGDGTYTFTTSVSLPSAPGYKGKSISTNLPIAPILAPVIMSAPGVTSTQGQSFFYQITGTDSPTVFNATGLPAWLSLNTVTGLISGMPTGGPGTFTATIGASNTKGSGSAVLTITVAPPAPRVTSTLAATAINGQPFRYQITGSNSPTGFSATGLPTGLSVNPDTGVISGTPTSVAGTFSSTIRVTNAGGSGSAVLTFTVQVPINELESRPPLLSIANGTSELRVENSVIGHWYQLQRTTELSPNTVWENIGTPQPGSNGVLIISDTTGMTGSKVFYRLQISDTP